MISTLAQNNAAGAGGAIVAIVFLVVFLAVIILVLAGMWKAFEKAGQPGWGVLIPIYNQYLMCKIGGRPGWWVILLLIPYLNIVIIAILMFDIAKSFGKGIGFALGLFFLGFIFFPILGFGDSEYQGPSAGY